MFEREREQQLETECEHEQQAAERLLALEKDFECLDELKESAEAKIADGHKFLDGDTDTIMDDETGHKKRGLTMQDFQNFIGCKKGITQKKN